MSWDYVYDAVDCVFKSKSCFKKRLWFIIGQNVEYQQMPVPSPALDVYRAKLKAEKHIVVSDLKSEIQPDQLFKLQVPSVESKVYHKHFSIFGERFQQKVVATKKKTGGLAARRRAKTVSKTKES